MRDCCLNLAVWCFSFRYWNIAHVLPTNLSGKQISTCYKVVSICLFLTLSLINVVVPFIYAYYSFQVNSMIGLSDDEIVTIWE